MAQTVYILQKDLPDVKAGAKGKVDESGFLRISVDRYFVGNPDYVFTKQVYESAIEWFKAEQPEPDWEILEIYRPKDNSLHTTYKQDIEILYLENLHNTEFAPFKVKRLSDGEVFSVGDNIYSEKNFNARFAIIEISLINDVQIYFNSCPLEFAVKLPQESPLPIKVEIEDMPLLSLNDVKDQYTSPRDSPLFLKFYANLYQWAKFKSQSLNK